MQVDRYEHIPAPDLLLAAGAVYTEAFDVPPYTEGPDSATGFYDRVSRYHQRPGFRLWLCRSGSDVIRLALSVHAHPGDRWRDRCAEALGPDGTARWLDPPIREVAHVGVSPKRQRNGAGRALTEDVLDDTDATSVVLSCHPYAKPAQSLYLSCGFQVLTEDFRTAPGQLGYRLLARQPAQR